jgi:hypothetical protein
VRTFVGRLYFVCPYLWLIVQGYLRSTEILVKNQGYPRETTVLVFLFSYLVRLQFQPKRHGNLVRKYSEK